jgi:lipopolysaccharide export system protein LptC
MGLIATPASRQKLGRLWDRVSLYLPVLAMGLLALLSYWVLRSSPLTAPPRAERAVTHHPDYFMHDFAVRSFAPDGMLESEIFGREARHYPDTQTLEIDQAKLHAVQPNSSQTNGSARKLSIDGANTRYRFEGQVKIVRIGNPRLGTPEMTFAGEELTILTEEQTISSTQPVVITRGSDRITAQSLQYSEKQRLATLQGQVRTTLAPRN